MSRPAASSDKPELASRCKACPAIRRRAVCYLDLEIVRQNRARQGERDLVAHFVVLRAANDLARLAAAVVDLADAEPVGVRMLR